MHPHRLVRYHAAGGASRGRAAVQCISSFPWGWASDRIGRKAVIQIGGLGQALSMLGLGFAGTYPAAVVARFVGGILNGTTGALKTTIAESYSEQQQAQVWLAHLLACRLHAPAPVRHKVAVAAHTVTAARGVQVLGYLSFGWGAGTIIGPAAGGFLAQPCDSFPRAFGSACAPGGLLARFPYLLPCLLAAFAALQSFVTVTVFLRESLDRSLQRERLGSRGSALLAFWGGRAAEEEGDGDALELAAFAREGRDSAAAEASAPQGHSQHGLLQSAQYGAVLEDGNARKASARRSVEVAVNVHVGCVDMQDCAERGSNGEDARLGGHHGAAGDGETEHLLSPTSQHSTDDGSGDAPWYTDRCATAAARCQALLCRAAAMNTMCPPCRRMLLILAGYGLVAFTYNMLDEVVPIYAATPKSHYGLGLSSSQLGVPLSVGGVALMLLAVFVYPRVRKRTGTYWCASFRCEQVICWSCALSKHLHAVASAAAFTPPTHATVLCRACRIGLTSSIGVALLFPVSSLIAEGAGDMVAFVYLSFIVCLRSASAIFAFTSVMVMVNLAAPKAHIGAVNGVGQALASFVRGIGPALGGTLWSLSISSGWAGSEFFVFVLISSLGVVGNVLFAAIGPG